ncbi:hypothetical protein POM88_012705 [Heracleum sosnowskyi]|uniref:Zinc knuckle CX2CX4HX4C domain-containing protein n=1 Tax=Heracleum sosnowskyi TaxID=360622 RepID=A0AAD8N210_9APIA|nr:hypothetical protein POM88_012705 [Heracleum sosnowskyi]
MDKQKSSLQEMEDEFASIQIEDEEEFLRIRVSIPVDSPIKRRMKLRKSEKEWCWVNFKYEAIPTFCFICGLIGHGDRFCDLLFDTPLDQIERPYGAWLRAEPRRKTHTMGTKWLRNGGGAQARNSDGKGGVDPDKESTVKVAPGKQLSLKSGIGNHSSGGDKSENSGKITVISEASKRMDIYQPILIQSNTYLEGELDGPDNIIVVDSKRRRTELDHEEPSAKAQDQTKDMDILSEHIRSSKNDVMAGTALQTRQSL